jgi:integrase
MKYLISHYDTFYFRRKLNYKNICISLRTKNKLEAKFILATINAKLEAIKLRLEMDSIEEVEYIKELLKEYVEVAKVEYSKLSDKREQKYTYTKKDGKVLLGSHPKAIKYHIKDLGENLYSSNNKEIAENIINDSNIKEQYKEALSQLSKEGQQRLLHEVIKAEIELLHYDKSRNEARTNPKKLQNTYIETDIYNPNHSYNTNNQLNDISDFKQLIKEIKDQEDSSFKIKTKEEVFNNYIELDYIKNDKGKKLDKVIPPIKTLLQASEHEYLVDYELKDYEAFFESLIYTPKFIYERSRIYNDYEGNYFQIAMDFKDSLEGDNLLEEYYTEEKLKERIQSIKNVDEKLLEINNFLDDCVKSNHIKNNPLKDNKRFSNKVFNKILTGTKKRKPFNKEELNLMFKKLGEYNNLYGFQAEQILIPIIALFSGLRVEEICKLRVEDIILDENFNIWYFDINGKVKTKSSERKVPIHSQLIEKFNFISYVDMRKNSNHEMLFDLKSIYYKGKIKFSHYFLRDYFTDFRNSFVTKKRIEEDLISFHSLRHSFATRLRSGRVEFYSISNLMGHTVDTILKNIFNLNLKVNETATYTGEDLKISKEDIEKLELNDIQKSIDNFETIYKTFFSVTNK